jgi:hypothetical protein
MGVAVTAARASAFVSSHVWSNPLVRRRRQCVGTEATTSRFCVCPPNDAQIQRAIIGGECKHSFVLPVSD